LRASRDIAGLARGFGPQAMIDGDRYKLRAEFERRAPARRQHKQRGRIRSAGNSEDESLEIFEIRKQRRGFRDRYRPHVVSS
jgi:hypothetical protein